MIQLTHCKNEDHAKGYFTEHLAVGDYYSQHDTVTGVWCGKGAVRLSLCGQATREAFLHLIANRHPVTGQQITPRNNGAGQRRIFTDVTFSAPKSVSILALVLRDQRVVAAYRAAVRAALQELEPLACTRVRKDGRDESRFTGNVVGCLFGHDTSRALDPQLHDHDTLFNSTFDEVEGRWKALDPGQIARRSGMLTEVFRNHLATQLREIGYEIRTSGKSFEVVGFPESIIKRFSKRHREIDEQEAAFGTHNNPQVRALVAHQLRAQKRKDITRAELEQLWRSQISDDEWQQLQQLVASANRPRPALGLDPMQVVTTAANHLLERQSVVAQHKLLQQALVFGRGGVDLDELRQAIEAQPDLLHGGEHFTSNAVAQMERDLFALVGRGLAACAPLHPQSVLSSRLSGEQANSNHFLLHHLDRFLFLLGSAGTGKSNLLQEFVAQVEAGGHAVHLCAANSGAVEELRQKGGFAAATTLHQVMEDPASLAGGVLVLDEAGQVCLRQMLDLFNAAEQHDFRVLLVGDTRQHHAVEAGDALRILEAHSPIARTELRTIQRQKRDDYLAAVRSLQKREIARGFFQLEKMEAVHELRYDHRYAQVARVVASSQQAEESCLVVCVTHHEAQRATEAIRSELRQRGLLRGDDVVLDVFDPQKWSREQKLEIKFYEPSHVLIFHRGRSPVKAGEAVSVLRAQDGFLLVQKRNGDVVPINVAEHANNFGVFTPRPISVAAGDRLWLRANVRTSSTGRMHNGELVTVQALHRDGSIALTDGRTIPATFRQFSHGYAQTSYAAQGKTVHRVLLVIDSTSAQEAASFESLYVGATRGSHDIQLYTDDKDTLLQAFLDFSSRTSALEFIGEAGLQKTTSLSSLPTSTNKNQHEPPNQKYLLQTAATHSSRPRPGPKPGLGDAARAKLHPRVPARRPVRRPRPADGSAGAVSGQRPVLGAGQQPAVRPPPHGAGR
jgi:conjugative relaxase-like TrwC/TraI family protein